MPLNEEYVLNKRLARQVYYQELHDKVRDNLQSREADGQAYRTQLKQAIDKRFVLLEKNQRQKYEDKKEYFAKQKADADTILRQIADTETRRVQKSVAEGRKYVKHLEEFREKRLETVNQHERQLYMNDQENLIK